ncbi:unnamed protein product [Closterium sp. Naga37s-1]|nr:unnamed protein product [Closterium sp. Naga37s-1]
MAALAAVSFASFAGLRALPASHGDTHGASTAISVTSSQRPGSGTCVVRADARRRLGRRAGDEDEGTGIGALVPVSPEDDAVQTSGSGRRASGYYSYQGQRAAAEQAAFVRDMEAAAAAQQTERQVLMDSDVAATQQSTYQRKTKIVCTIGPTSNTREMLWKLAETGMNVVRLNMSHGDHQSHRRVVDLVREYNKGQASQGAGNVLAIMLDTKGPEVRSGDLPQPIELEPGESFTFTIRRGVGSHRTVSVNYDGFIDDVDVDDIILVDGGMMSFQVKRTRAEDVVCEVLDGGDLKSRRHLNVRGKSATLPSITGRISPYPQFAPPFPPRSHLPFPRGRTSLSPQVAPPFSPKSHLPFPPGSASLSPQVAPPFSPRSRLPFPPGRTSLFPQVAPPFSPRSHLPFPADRSSLSPQVTSPLTLLPSVPSHFLRSLPPFPYFCLRRMSDWCFCFNRHSLPIPLLSPASPSLPCLPISPLPPHLSPASPSLPLPNQLPPCLPISPFASPSFPLPPHPSPTFPLTRLPASSFPSPPSFPHVPPSFPPFPPSKPLIPIPLPLISSFSTPFPHFLFSPLRPTATRACSLVTDTEPPAARLTRCTRCAHSCSSAFPHPSETLPLRPTVVLAELRSFFPFTLLPLSSFPACQAKCAV